ncbi:NADPH:quinone reductase [Geomonas sp. RF6]|uniref:NADPH:quinone reductase n=1 Tax=Geomonas sp. RF6 TaxID=2897342 RepID=UPI001E4DCE51|nr:NADPH:quinone reductase [Geomonas sp. RF6]UFS72012.1 NADPH:quinone reductase [Geomonas sp. RF6]
MKGIAIGSFGEPEIMKLADLPDPHPGPGQVVVKVAAAGVNPVDTYIRSGIYGEVPFPFTPGIDGAGIIEAVGEGVRHRKVGERVYVAFCISGTYAEKVLCNEFQTHPLPDRISFAQGAAIGVPYGAAYRALFQKAQAKGGETVLVHGASGGVGIAAVQLARGAGLWVLATAGSEEGRRLVLEQGAHEVIDHHAPGHLRQLAEKTCGRGLDVILEMLANVNLGEDLGALAQGGRVVVVGSRGRVEIDPRDLMKRESAVMGITLFNATEREHQEMHAAFRAGLESGTLRPVVSKELPLSEAAQAHHLVMEKSTFGKIVLVP